MNPNKVNQDRLYIKENVLMSNQQNMSIFAVADGHGPFGHHVSHLIVDHLYKRFDNNLKIIGRFRCHCRGLLLKFKICLLKIFNLMLISVGPRLLRLLLIRIGMQFVPMLETPGLLLPGNVILSPFSE